MEEKSPPVRLPIRPVTPRNILGRNILGNFWWGLPAVAPSSNSNGTDGRACRVSPSANRRSHRHGRSRPLRFAVGIRGFFREPAGYDHVAGSIAGGTGGGCQTGAHVCSPSVRHRVAPTSKAAARCREPKVITGGWPTLPFEVLTGTRMVAYAMPESHWVKVSWPGVSHVRRTVGDLLYLPIRDFSHEMTAGRWVSGMVASARNSWGMTWR